MCAYRWGTQVTARHGGHARGRIGGLKKKKKIGEKGIYLRQVERRGLPFFGYEAKGDMKRKAVASGRRGQGQKLTRQDDGTK